MIFQHFKRVVFAKKIMIGHDNLAIAKRGDSLDNGFIEIA